MTTAARLDEERLGLVFQSRPDIIKSIRKEADSPSRIKLFNEIASFVQDQIGGHSGSPEPAQKRRRVDVQPSLQNGTASNGASATGTSSAEDVAAENTLLEIKEISVSIPQRKKFDLCFTAKHLYARAPNTTAPIPGIIYPWKHIEYAFYLPVPEKAQVQHNYILFPKNSYLPTKDSTASSADPLVFTVSAGAPKPGSIGGPNAGAAAAVSDSYTTLFHWAINKCLQAGGNEVKVVAADPARFRSAARQPHRPKEPAVHVRAFRGSKDGYLFFLENGILWGFKKPLLFIPLDRVAAVSYTSVLQRTFNIVVEVFTGGGKKSEDANGTSAGGDEAGDAGEETEEIEFSMLDQEDYAGINENYVARHGLQDRSLADQRKAKMQLLENAKGGHKKGAADADADGEDDRAAAGAGTAGVSGDDDGMTELQRARREAEQKLQDEEDEDEEDYDPGSDGDSEGEGTSSEEGEGDDDDDGDDDGDDDVDENDDGEMDEGAD